MFANQSENFDFFVTLDQPTERCVFPVSFPVDSFIVVNPPERKLEKHTSVQPGERNKLCGLIRIGLLLNMCCQLYPESR